MSAYTSGSGLGVIVEWSEENRQINAERAKDPRWIESVDRILRISAEWRRRKRDGRCLRCRRPGIMKLDRGSENLLHAQKFR